jgi:GNAT superfamily N-acetyltransferase
MDTTLNIRRAQRHDSAQLTALQHASMRELGQCCYDEAVIEAFLAHVGTMDTTLIDDGTLFTARIGTILVGCGGWSTRTPGYAAHMGIEPAASAEPHVTIRSIYVHPLWARRGIARRMMAAVEADIVAAGYDTAALTATLTGIPFYRQLGYHGQEPAIIRLPGDHVLVGLCMEKRLAMPRSVLPLAA